MLGVDNGYGGRTDYEYEPVSGLAKAQRRVTKEWTRVEVSGTLNTVGLNTFEYGSTVCVDQAGTSCYSGYTLKDSQALVGHDQVTVVGRDPASNAELSVAHTRFHLDLPRVGQAYLTEQQAAATRQPHARTVVSYTVFTGTQVGEPGLPDGVWFTAPTTQTAYPNVTDAPGLFNTSTMSYTGGGAGGSSSYGAWQSLRFLGQSLAADEWGNVQPSSGGTPYRRQETDYVFTSTLATGVFLLRPAGTRRYEGTTLVTEVRNTYDGSTAPATAGSLSLGDLTQAQYTTDLSGTDLPETKTISITYQYDSSGRPTQQTMGSRTATIHYDVSFGDFVTRVVDAAGTPLERATNYEYYGLNESAADGSGPFGALKTVVDPNGQRTQYAYDAFGRVTAVVKPGDTFSFPTQATEYGDLQGALMPLRITARQREQSGSLSGCLSGGAECVHSTYTFYDGLGRALQTKSEAHSAAQGGSQVLVSVSVSHSSYDALGRARYQSVPEYLSGSGADTVPF